MSQRTGATLENVRRLVVTKQHLAGKLPSKPNADTILRIIRDLGCVELDPITAVALSHLIVLWSRLGNYDRSDLAKEVVYSRKVPKFWRSYLH